MLFPFLRIVKLFDLAQFWVLNQSQLKFQFKRSSYEIRTKILELCSPLMSTTEAYTMTLDPNKMKDPIYLQRPENWIPEL